MTRSCSRCSSRPNLQFCRSLFQKTPWGKQQPMYCAGSFLSSAAALRPASYVSILIRPPVRARRRCIGQQSQLIVRQAPAHSVGEYIASGTTISSRGRYTTETIVTVSSDVGDKMVATDLTMGDGYSIIEAKGPKWRNWQTRGIQNPVPARA